MDSCEQVQDALIDYINHRLSQSERSRIAVHLSVCKSCREEVAFLIKVSQSCNIEITDVPVEIARTAFEKIPDSKPNYGLKQYLAPVFDSFRLAGQTLRFAKQNI